jgi:hypothetical protein
MTAALAKPALTAPLPAEIDERAEAFHKLEEELIAAKKTAKDAQEKVSAKELELIELVRACGSPHHEKSKILHGILWEMMATFAQYRTLDGAAVDRFRNALVEAKQTRILKKIFRQDIRWTIEASGLDEVVKTGKLSAKLMSLLLQCTVTQDKKPSLDVRLKKKTA